ncbi:MAG: hypothetical protein WKF55_04105 [Gemmatimonadaceae bacterium]
MDKKAKGEAKKPAKKPAKKYSAPIVTRHGNIRMMVQMYSPS